MTKYIQEYKYNGFTYIVKIIGYDDAIAKSMIESSSNLLVEWWCGYVVISKGHGFYNVDYDYCKIDCHGGLTYGEFGLPGSEKYQNEWIIGFDCNHYYDNEVTNNEAFVKHECMKIIDQLVGE